MEKRFVRKDGKVIWNLFYCQACNYSFRDTETENVLTPASRKAIFQVDADNRDIYKPMMPGMV